MLIEGDMDLVPACTSKLVRYPDTVHLLFSLFPKKKKGGRNPAVNINIQVQLRIVALISYVVDKSNSLTIWLYLKKSAWGRSLDLLNGCFKAVYIVFVRALVRGGRCYNNEDNNGKGTRYG